MKNRVKNKLLGPSFELVMAPQKFFTLNFVFFNTE